MMQGTGQQNQDVREQRWSGPNVNTVNKGQSEVESTIKSCPTKTTTAEWKSVECQQEEAQISARDMGSYGDQAIPKVSGVPD